MKCECGGELHLFDNFMLGCNKCEHVQHIVTYCHTVTLKLEKAEGELAELRKPMSVDSPHARILKVKIKELEGELALQKAYNEKHVETEDALARQLVDMKKEFKSECDLCFECKFQEYEKLKADNARMRGITAERISEVITNEHNAREYYDAEEFHKFVAVGIQKLIGGDDK